MISYSLNEERPFLLMIGHLYLVYSNDSRYNSSLCVYLGSKPNGNPIFLKISDGIDQEEYACLDGLISDGMKISELVEEFFGTVTVSRDK